MLINHENIQRCFKKNLAWATGIDVASAWATSNAGLRALQIDRAAPLRIRAVVGLSGHSTDPATLGTLADIGELRTIDKSRLFHPKVYVFYGKGKSVAWVGSANFTSGGFGKNEELLFETSDTKAVEEWFNQLWERCGPLDENILVQYAKKHAEWRQLNQPIPLAPTLGKGGREPLQLLKNVSDWRSYVDALERCNNWWRAGHSWSVLGETYSWSETIQVLHDIVKRKDWGAVSDYDRKRLLGLTGGSGEWALLGRMRAPAVGTVFGRDCEKIKRVVLGVTEFADGDFPHKAVKAYEELCKFEGVGPGIATRLLTLARPDRFVSLNNASRTGLADSFGLASSTLHHPKNYGLLLEVIYSQDWYRDPAPESESTISWMRAALLDCFVYKSRRG